MSRTQNPGRPVWLPAGVLVDFPDPRRFDERGLIAVGGDLDPPRVLRAYRRGIFPWFDEPPILWWSPSPRAVFDPEHLHVSRSLRRHLRHAAQDKELTVTPTNAIEEVMRACGELRESSWINEPMLRAYVELGRMGAALAYEVRRDGQLVGGLYGVKDAGLYAAESMFHIETNASKVALVASVLHRFALGTRLFDVQFETGHLNSMGAYEITRDEYLARLASALTQTHTLPPGTGLDSQTALGPEKIPRPGEDILPWVVERLEVL